MPVIDQDDPFRQLYNATVEPDHPLSVETGAVLLTLSAYDMPLSVLSRILSDRFNIGLVYVESVASKKITAEFKDTDLTSVLNVISRQISVDVIRVGNTYFIGILRPEDRGVLVRRVLGHDADRLDSILKSMLSVEGRVSITRNSVAVVTDHESVLRRVAEMLDYLDAQESRSWIVQLYFVALRKDMLLEGGLTTKSSGTISYDISSNKISVENLRLDGFFEFLNNSSYADLYASPMFIIRDGYTARWHDGERVPIPKKTISEQGTVTTTGFDYIDTGLVVTAALLESSIGANLTLDITFSDVKSYVEYSPVTSQTVFKTDVDMQTNKIYLLGELSKFKHIDKQEDTLRFGADRGKVVLQVWGKVYKIDGSVKASYPYKGAEATGSAANS